MRAPRRVRIVCLGLAMAVVALTAPRLTHSCGELAPVMYVQLAEVRCDSTGAAGLIEIHGAPIAGGSCTMGRVHSGIHAVPVMSHEGEILVFSAFAEPQTCDAGAIWIEVGAAERYSRDRFTYDAHPIYDRTYASLVAAYDHVTSHIARLAPQPADFCSAIEVTAPQH